MRFFGLILITNILASTIAINAFAKKTESVSPFFSSQGVLEIHIELPFRQVMADKSGNMHLNSDITNEEIKRDKEVSLTAKLNFGYGDLPIKIKPRGVYRLGYCKFPPLKLEFESRIKEGLLKNIKELKLVTHCDYTTAIRRMNSTGKPVKEDPLLQEEAMYRMYKQISPYSLNTRLLKVTYKDSNKEFNDITELAFAIEDFSNLRRRYGSEKIIHFSQDEIDKRTAVRLAIFQSMISNHDWDVELRHNTKYLKLPNGKIQPVPYDFDFSGLVDFWYSSYAPFGVELRPWPKPKGNYRLKHNIEKYESLCLMNKRLLNSELKKILKNKNQILREHVILQSYGVDISMTHRLLLQWFETVETKGLCL